MNLLFKRFPSPPNRSCKWVFFTLLLLGDRLFAQENLGFDKSSSKLQVKEDVDLHRFNSQELFRKALGWAYRFQSKEGGSVEQFNGKLSLVFSHQLKLYCCSDTTEVNFRLYISCQDSSYSFRFADFLLSPGHSFPIENWYLPDAEKLAPEIPCLKSSIDQKIKAVLTSLKESMQAPGASVKSDW